MIRHVGVPDVVIRRLIRNALVLALLLCCGAADTTHGVPPPESPAFRLPGRGVLLAEDFSGDLAAWRPDRAGVWSVRHGVLRGDLPDQRQVRSLIWAGDSTWQDYALDFDVCMMRGVDKGAVVRAQGDIGIGVDVRGGSYQDVVAYVRQWPLGKAGAITSDAAWNHVQIETVAERVRVWINGELRLDRTQARTRRGRIALAAYTGGGGQCTVYYDNVAVTER